MLVLLLFSGDAACLEVTWGGPVGYITFAVMFFIVLCLVVVD
jgi:hypothetical protein